MNRFPFTAVVGADDMALALTLSAVSPAIGGVLVRGEKGTAKSTMVRALPDLLPPIDVITADRFSSDPADPSPLSPDGPFAADAPTSTRAVRLVELPVGATEDRVLGSIHLEKALTSGVSEYEPGLLAAAHRGILYVDEVNLLHDHLVDLLLDAAAMGRSTVERDGVSVSHAAQFVLVGTMNPEEGELRPQLLDRFGLTVEVAAPRDPSVRVEVVRRRLAYEQDPTAFTARYAGAERELGERIATAQAVLDDVELGLDVLTKIAEVCAAFEVDGMRADIVTARTAVAHAAWQGRLAVTRADVRAAARLAIPHRRRRNPFDAPGIDEDLLDAILGDDEPEPDPPSPAPDDEPGGDADDDQPEQADAPPHQPGEAPPETTEPTDQPPNQTAEAEQEPAPEPEPEPQGDQQGGQSPTSVVAPQEAYRTRLFQVPGAGAGEAGRRSRALTTSGRTVGARRPDGEPGAIHLLETIRAAAPHQRSRGASGPGLSLRGGDLRLAVKEGRESNLVLLCVDASGSMAARRRMEQVKTAVLSLLLDAYQRRDKVGLVTFRGQGAALDLPPTGSVEIAAARLRELPAGGRTPLAEGLWTASETLRLERIRDPRRRPLLVVVTDGRATAGADAVGRSRQMADHLAAQGVASMVVDCETGRFRMGLARTLSDHLQAAYVPLGEIAAEQLAAVVRQGADAVAGRAA
ncbi:VWA domain-containing protein [Solicola sp. PLA-1-18]|uniref:VWA domain-containing protein n=1 Tax=Solicola sp. PLA-1-18 TaxID=3380532 RepID=UPI003B7CAD80